MKRGVATALLVFLTLPSAAGAQMHANEINKWRGFQWTKGSARAYQSLGKFADCVLNRNGVEVSRLLAIPVDDPGVAELWVGLARNNPDCLPGIALKFDSGVLRSALIRAAYQRDVLKNGSAKPSMILGRDPGLIDTAKCIVRQDPASADAMVRSAPGSSEEKTAFGELASAAGQCRAVTPKTLHGVQKMKYDLTEAMYRLRLDQGGAAR